MSEPREHVCIFHQRQRALQVYKVRDSANGNWFEYGLCPICDHRLKKQESFKNDISARLEELMHKLEKQEEKKMKTQLGGLQ